MVGFPNKPMGFPTKKWSALGVWNGGFSRHLRNETANILILKYVLVMGVSY